MAHFRLIKSAEILSGPVDFSAPVGDAAVFLCSSTVKDHIERRKPAGRAFTANEKHNSFWLRKFEVYTDTYPDFVKYARGKSGCWYVEACFL